MSEAETLPTRRDEAWRYSDTDTAAKLWPVEAERIEVAAGENLDWQILLAPGADDEGSQRVDQAFGGESKASHRFESGDIADDEAIVRRLEVSVGEGGRFALHALLAGGKLNRLAIDVTLAKGAHFELGGITLGGGNSLREIVTHVTHAEPDGTSNQVIRSVHWGQGTGNFLGQIDVVRHAQKTDAAQDFKGLLLEKGASVNAVPQLEIFADDVQCAHGAAIGQLDENAAYYMAARGIPPKLARKLLVQAFVGDAFVAIEDEELHDRMLQAALDALEDRAP